RHVLYGIQTLLRPQRGDTALAAVDLDDALIGNPVRAFPVGRALEQEAVAAQLQTVTGNHAQVALTVEQAGAYHAHGADRDTHVGQHHAPVAARQSPHATQQTLVTGLVEDVAQGAAGNPEHQKQHAA